LFPLKRHRSFDINISSRLNARMIIDITCIIAFNITAFFFFAHIDFLETLIEFTQQYEDYEVDEFIPLFFTLSLSLAIFAERRRREAVSLKEKYLFASCHDHLTGLYNRLYLINTAETEIERHQRTGSLFSILLIDIDKFKKINDLYGHHIGDLVLQEFSLILQETIRKIDVAARWGGEEFIILCRDTDHTGAITLAQKIQTNLAEHTFTGNQSVTASIGIAAFEKNTSFSTLIEAADLRLYQAKAAGRNRIVAQSYNAS